MLLFMFMNITVWRSGLEGYGMVIRTFWIDINGPGLKGIDRYFESEGNDIQRTHYGATAGTHSHEAGIRRSHVRSFLTYWKTHNRF